MPNYNEKTGIPYGIIHTNHLQGWIWEEFEAVYPECRCGVDSDDCGDCFCEPIGYTYEGEGIKASIDEVGDVWVFESPYTMPCLQCSPCAPGARDLSAYDEHSEKAYCLPPEWFEPEFPHIDKIEKEEK